MMALVQVSLSLDSHPFAAIASWLVTMVPDSWVRSLRNVCISAFRIVQLMCGLSRALMMHSQVCTLFGKL